MAFTLTLTGDKSILTTDYFPTIDLDTEYVCGLIDFQTYNSIPNVDSSNNLLHIGDKVITLPEGSYEIEDINKYLQNSLPKGYNCILKANNNTLRSEIKSNMEINFNKNNSIGSLLGFSRLTNGYPNILKSNKLYESNLPVNIIKVNVIRVGCNITASSFINNKPDHTIHEFSPMVGPGYKIVEVPQNVVYLPVTVKRITSIAIKIVDQNDNIVNFRGENITVRLHFKPI